MKATYLLGIKDCEKLYQSGSTFTELLTHVESEAKIGGYKWDNWVEGFKAAIEHFEKLESFAMCGVGGGGGERLS